MKLTGVSAKSDRITPGSLLCIFPWLELGGSDKFNLEVIRHLATQGWSITIVTTLSSSHNWRPLFVQHAYSIIDLTQFPLIERPIRLVQIAQDNQCTTVFISNSNFGYHLLPYLRAHLTSSTFIDFCHAEELTGEGGYPALSISYSDYLDAQITASQHLKEWMCAKGGEPIKSHVCTINIDTEEWDRVIYDKAFLRHKLDISEPMMLVLYAARLDRGKQPLLALDVMRDVLRQRPDTVFLIAGDGQFAPYVRGFIRAHRLQNSIRLLGAQPTERIRELLAISDVFFLPSEMEGISLAIYEAMAMGVVPVSANVGGQSELVTPEVGVLVERGSHERAAYTAALLDVLNNPERLREQGDAARQRMKQHFRLDQMGERMLALFEQAQQRHATDLRPVDAAAALVSARAAIANAEAAEAAQATLDRPLRRWARDLYWATVERGAWWMVPMLEKMRRDVP